VPALLATAPACVIVRNFVAVGQSYRRRGRVSIILSTLGMGAWRMPHIIIIIIIINVLIKVTLNEIRCRGTLQSQWSTLTESTSLKAEENVNVTDKSRSI